jgi:hypothetical protein
MTLVHHSLPYCPSKIEFQGVAILGFLQSFTLLIDYRVKLLQLDSQRADAKPLIFPEPNFFTIPNMPSQAHLSGSNIPHNPLIKRGAISIYATEDIGTVGRVLKIYNFSPQLTFSILVSLHP